MYLPIVGDERIRTPLGKIPEILVPTDRPRTQFLPLYAELPHHRLVDLQRINDPLRIHRRHGMGRLAQSHIPLVRRQKTRHQLPVPVRAQLHPVLKTIHRHQPTGGMQHKTQHPREPAFQYSNLVERGFKPPQPGKRVVDVDQRTTVIRPHNNRLPILGGFQIT